MLDARILLALLSFFAVFYKLSVNASCFFLIYLRHHFPFCHSVRQLRIINITGLRKQKVR